MNVLDSRPREQRARLNPREHIVESQQFDGDFLGELFELTDYMKAHEFDVGETLRNRLVGMLFYEPSTRTRFSFEAAVHRLGGRTMETENATQFSSARKGESLEHSIRVMGGNADFIVLRHTEDDASERAVRVSRVPIINAGSGEGQHPTQAALDVYTIHEKFGRLHDLEIAVIGDLKRGRTVNSLVYLLSKFPNNRFYFVAHDESRIKLGIIQHLQENDVSYVETEDLDGVLGKVHVGYMTRDQAERSNQQGNAKPGFVIDRRRFDLMQSDSILMHPMPISDRQEITPDLDPDQQERNPKARWFVQADNGKYVRMALLKMMYDHVYNHAA